ncbi:hypothetical protein [Brasilonema sennae]|uniref:hypothetical protein n=1 Tax=Brasilonema sennae TaxID=1397703 RepID=UPI001551DF38|nr:hypothetical protein [Brasilonema sennae]
MPAARLRLSGLVARQSPGSGGTRQPVATTGGTPARRCSPHGAGSTTRLTRRQIPSEGNPHQVLAPQGTTLGSAGFTARRCSGHRSGT